MTTWRNEINRIKWARLLCCYMRSARMGVIALMIIGVLTSFAPAEASTSGKDCLAQVSPVDTAITTLTPTLQWVNMCGISTYRLKLSINSQVIYETEIHRNSPSTAYINEVQVPSGILKYGNTYNWVIDAGAIGIKAGTFRILKHSALEEFHKELGKLEHSADSIATREAIIHLMFLYDLRDLALAEADRLQEDLFARRFSSAGAATVAWKK